MDKMTQLDPLMNLTSLDFELVTYRKGCLHAYVNLENGYLTWRDSRQWCNNFTRTLNETQIQAFRNHAATSSLIAQMEPTPDGADDQACSAFDAGVGSGHSTSSWMITALVRGQAFRMGGAGAMTDCAETLKLLIEKLCRVSFDI